MARSREWTRESEQAALARLQREPRPVVLAYGRQSKTERDGEGNVIGVSLDLQKDEWQRRPELAGCPVEYFEDADTSGKNPAINNGYVGMMDRLQSAPLGIIGAIYGTDQDRLGRNVIEFYKLMEECEDRGVLVFDAGGLIRNEDELKWGVKAVFAAVERKKIARRVRDALRHKKEQGWVGGHIAIGYVRVICTHRATKPKCDCPENRLAVDPEWAPVVVIIFELYATGRFSFETLARHLNDELKMAAPERRWRTQDGNWHGDNRWHVDGLKNMLQSPTYISRTHVGRNHAVEQRDAAHEAIISPELWQQCQAIRELNKKRKQAYRRKGEVESRPVAHALSGVVKCARCGGSMHHQPGKRDDQHWYHCANSYRGKTCEHKTWHLAPEVEDMVRTALAFVASPDQADPASVKRLAASMTKTVDPHQALRERLKRLDTQLEKVLMEHRLGDISDERYMELRGHINEQKQAARAEAEKGPVLTVADGQRELISIIAEWDAAAKAGNGLAGVRRNQLVREVLERVEVDFDPALGTMLTVSPKPAWAGLFRMALLAKQQVLTAKVEVAGGGPAYIDGLVLSGSHGSGGQTNARAPMLPVSPCA